MNKILQNQNIPKQPLAGPGAIDKGAALQSRNKPAVGNQQGSSDIAQSARNFEQAFIVQMLKDAGFDKAVMGSAGGASQMYGSFLLEAVADKIVQSGGLGLSAIIESSLKDVS